jgi:hypothetical protein
LRLRIAAATVIDRESFNDKLAREIGEYAHDRNKWLPSVSIFFAYFDAAWSLFQEERYASLEPPKYTNNIEKGRYLDYLIRESEKLEDPQALVAEFIAAAAMAFVAFAKRLPSQAFSVNPRNIEREHFATVALLDSMRGEMLDFRPLVGPFFLEKPEALGLFKQFRERILANVERTEAKWKQPDSVPLTAATLDSFFRGTPFRGLYDTPIPFDIPISRLLEHSVLVAGAGHGKTQTLGALIARHLREQDPPAMVVIDSTGALIKKIHTLAMFHDRLRHRIVIIDPEHRAVPAPS